MACRSASSSSARATATRGSCGRPAGWLPACVSHGGPEMAPKPPGRLGTPMLRRGAPRRLTTLEAPARAQDVRDGATWGGGAVSQPRYATPRTSAAKTTTDDTREASDSSANVPLESPAKTRPTTGRTGAPHPTTLQGPVESASTLATAPTDPPAAWATRRPWSTSAKYTPMRTPMAMKRSTSAVSTAKPHSGAPYGPSAVTQNQATRERKSSLLVSGTSDTRYAGSFFSQGLNAAYVHGARVRARTTGGRSTSRVITAAATATTVQGRVRTAADTPRPIRPSLDMPVPTCYSEATLS